MSELFNADLPFKKKLWVAWRHAWPWLLFIALVTNIITDAIDRHYLERRLELQQEANREIIRTIGGWFYGDALLDIHGRVARDVEREKAELSRRQKDD